MFLLLIYACLPIIFAELPQDPALATGVKRTLVVRMDFPDSTSSNDDWLTTGTAQDWFGTDLNDFYQLSSFDRMSMDVTVETIIVRMPEDTTSYADCIELYYGLQDAMDGDPNDPSNFDLVIGLWEHWGWWSWYGQASSSSGTRPAVYFLNDDSYNIGLWAHEISHALGNGPHTAAWMPDLSTTDYGPQTLSGLPFCSSDLLSGCAADQVGV